MKRDPRSNPNPSTFNWFMVLLLSAGVVGLDGCGSTKVITAGKSIVYNDGLYNASNVRVFVSRTEVVVSPTQTIALSHVDKAQFNAVLMQHKPMMVRQVISMDAHEMIYQTKNIDSWSAYQDMEEKFASAQKQIARFLADKHETQLKLK